MCLFSWKIPPLLWKTFLRMFSTHNLYTPILSTPGPPPWIFHAFLPRDEAWRSQLHIPHLPPPGYCMNVCLEMKYEGHNSISLISPPGYCMNVCLKIKYEDHNSISFITPPPGYCMNVCLEMKYEDHNSISFISSSEKSDIELSEESERSSWNNIFTIFFFYHFLYKK